MYRKNDIRMSELNIKFTGHMYMIVPSMSLVAKVGYCTDLKSLPTRYISPYGEIEIHSYSTEVDTLQNLIDIERNVHLQMYLAKLHWRNELFHCTDKILLLDQFKTSCESLKMQDYRYTKPKLGPRKSFESRKPAHRHGKLCAPDVISIDQYCPVGHDILLKSAKLSRTQYVKLQSYHYLAWYNVQWVDESFFSENPVQTNYALQSFLVEHLLGNFSGQNDKKMAMIVEVLDVLEFKHVFDTDHIVHTIPSSQGMKNTTFLDDAKLQKLLKTEFFLNYFTACSIFNIRKNEEDDDEEDKKKSKKFTEIEQAEKDLDKGIWTSITAMQQVSLMLRRAHIVFNSKRKMKQVNKKTFYYYQYQLDKVSVEKAMERVYLVLHKLHGKNWPDVLQSDEVKILLKNLESRGLQHYDKYTRPRVANNDK